MTTGDDIRTARQRAGLTQADLAQRIGVSMRTVGNWERGETPPDRHAARIHAVLDGLISNAERSSIEDYSDAALLAEIARRFDSTRSIRERSTDQTLADQPQPDGATIRLSDRRPRLLGGEDPRILEMPFAADKEKPDDDPGEDDD